MMILLLIIFSENSIYTDEMFHMRFQMNRPLFLRIVDGLSNWSPYFTPSATIVIPPEMHTKDNHDPSNVEALRRNLTIKAHLTRQLKKDLIDHIWQRYGNKQN
jgi:hypothetical protein